MRVGRRAAAGGTLSHYRTHRQGYSAEAETAFYHGQSSDLRSGALTHGTYHAKMSGTHTLYCNKVTVA